uniref:Transmembrane protein n=1 Tax=Angiostrongylus cantonensis TaxID=6313 RepID=A0A0K0DKL5_ANGCA
MDEKDNGTVLKTIELWFIVVICVIAVLKSTSCPRLVLGMVHDIVAVIEAGIPMIYEQLNFQLCKKSSVQ